MQKHPLYFIFSINCFVISLVSYGQHSRGMIRFGAMLDTVRQQLKIPGMAAAVMERDSIVFLKGLGFADVKNHIPVTEHTTFRVASVTKTFTATLVMQLAEQGKLDLNLPISQYGLDFGNPRITVKNLLTHTSEGIPGTHFQYNGYRYGRLGPVLEKAAGQPFYQLLMEKILQPCGMLSSAPGIPIFDYFTYTRQRKDMQPYFETAFTNLAKPYGVDAKGNVYETTYLDEFGAFGGLVTCVNDLLKYSMAIDRNQFINARSQQQAFTPNLTNDGLATPYGFGWFTQNYQGLDLYWHYGQTQGESALFVKVPARRLTFVVTANSDQLSQPFPLGDGDLFTSPLGQLFYHSFINTDTAFKTIDYNQPLPVLKKQFAGIHNVVFREFYNKEILTQSVLGKISGDTAKSLALLELYADLNFSGLPKPPAGTEIVSLKDVSINQDISKPFTLAVPAKIRVYGVGENCSGDFSSWCDYGSIEDSTGKIIWQMQGQPAHHAGGAIKNQLVDTLISLQPGSYMLHYKSDAGHAYNSWDSAPPDNFFWGIILFGSLKE